MKVQFDAPDWSIAPPWTFARLLVKKQLYAVVLVTAPPL